MTTVAIPSTTDHDDTWGDPGSAPGHDNPVRGRLTSLLLARTEPQTHDLLGDVRLRVFGSLGGRVVDLGAGNGPTLKYLSDEVDVVHAIEPSRHFHRRLRAEAEDLGLEVRCMPCPARPWTCPTPASTRSCAPGCGARSPTRPPCWPRRGESCARVAGSPSSSTSRPPWAAACAACSARSPAPGATSSKAATSSATPWQASAPPGSADVEAESLHVRSSAVPIRSQVAGSAIR